MRTITRPPTPPKVEVVLTEKEAEFLHCLVAGTTAKAASIAFEGTKLEEMDTMVIYERIKYLYASFNKALKRTPLKRK